MGLFQSQVPGAVTQLPVHVIYTDFHDEINQSTYASSEVSEWAFCAFSRPEPSGNTRLVLPTMAGHAVAESDTHQECEQKRDFHCVSPEQRTKLSLFLFHSLQNFDKYLGLSLSAPFAGMMTRSDQQHKCAERGAPSPIRDC